MTMRDAPLTIPAVTPATAGYWRQLEGGVFVLPCCESCGHRWFPPATVCPRCLSDRVGYAPASGRGRIWSWTVMHRRYFDGFEPPYAVAVIRLNEGPLVTSAIVGSRADDLRCDLPVRVVLEKFKDGRVLPYFEVER